jgi:hypothetical protein
MIEATYLEPSIVNVKVPVDPKDKCIKSRYATKVYRVIGYIGSIEILGSIIKENMTVNSIALDTGINPGRVHLILKQMDYAGIIIWHPAKPPLTSTPPVITEIGKSLYQYALEMELNAH